MNKIFWIGILAVLLVTGCKKEEQGHVDGQPMTITSFTPETGDGGKSILITGTNFSSDTSEIEVTINGNKLFIVGANNSQIMAVVPKRCGTGPINIKIGGSSVLSKDTFNYIFTRTVTTLAGSGTAGYQNGKGDVAMFNFNGASWYRSLGVSVDDNLNVYVADPGNHCIRKIDAEGNVTNFAGNPNEAGHGDGKGAAAKFNLPYSTAVDENGNVYTVDPINWDIRKISPDGEATTIGWAQQEPWSVAYDNKSKAVYYVGCNGNATVFKLDNGNSVPIVQGLVYPCGMGFDENGNLFVSGHGSNAIYRFTANTWQQEVIAGAPGVAGYLDGIGSAARFSLPWGLAVDKQGNAYVAGNGTTDGLTSHVDQSVRMVAANTKKVLTMAGSGTAGFKNGIGGAASFSAPGGVAVDKNGTVYVLDKNNNCIRKIVSE